jgi:hypothetical protein
MFITCTRGYDRDGSQKAKGIFLMLMQTDTQSKPLRAIVRSCSMSQCGHWMMGSIRVKDQSITVSGSYGSDGLPKTVSDEIYNLGIELPKELYAAWNNGGGWNSAGSEGSSIRQWAIDNVLTNSQRASMKRRYDYKG